MQCWLSHSALIVPLSYLCRQKPRWSPTTVSKSSAFLNLPFPSLHCSHWHRGELGPLNTPELQPRRAQFSSLWPEGIWESRNPQAAQRTPAPKWCRPCWDEHSLPNTSLHLWAPLLSRSPWLPQSSCSPGLMEHRCALKGVSVNQNPHLWTFPRKNHLLTITYPKVPKEKAEQEIKQKSEFLEFLPLYPFKVLKQDLWSSSSEKSVVLTGRQETTTVRYRFVML